MNKIDTVEHIYFLKKISQKSYLFVWGKSGVCSEYLVRNIIWKLTSPCFFFLWNKFHLESSVIVSVFSFPFSQHQSFIYAFQDEMCWSIWLIHQKKFLTWVFVDLLNIALHNLYSMVEFLKKTMHEEDFTPDFDACMILHFTKCMYLPEVILFFRTRLMYVLCIIFYCFRH